MEEKSIMLLSLLLTRVLDRKEIISLFDSPNSLEMIKTKLISQKMLNKDILEHCKNIFEDCKKENIIPIAFFDNRYPVKLRNLASISLLLFTKGNLDLLDLPTISIVGSRKSSKNTLNWTYTFSKDASESGYVIVSGGALGVDTYAHKAALDTSGRTICVLGSGLNNIYPKENIELIKKIMENGLVISSYIPSSNVDKYKLLERNRITSALGDRILIVSTGITGGAMSQFKISQQQKKNISCLSPSLELEPTEGILHIIKNNKIKLIKDFRDFVTEQNSTEKQTNFKSYFSNTITI